MKKLVSLLSALLVGVFVGCAAEDSTSTPAPTTPTTPSTAPEGGMEEAPGTTPDAGETSSTPDAGAPTDAGETPATTPESTDAP